VQKFLGRPFIGADAPFGCSLIDAMTVRQSVFAFHPAGSALLLLTLALLSGVASAEDCVVAGAPKAAAVPATPRPVVRGPVHAPVRPPVVRAPPIRPPVVRQPQPTDVNALATPKAQPQVQARPQPHTQARPLRPAGQRVVVHRKRPAAPASIAASEQAPKPVANNPVPTCAPLADPQTAPMAPLKEAPRFTPIDPPMRLVGEPSARQDPLEGIRTGLPGEGMAPPFQVAQLSPPIGGGGGGGGSPLPVLEKPASAKPPTGVIPPVGIIPPVELIPPVTDRPIDPGTPPDPDRPHPVPVPGSVWLVLAGLAGLLHQRCRSTPRPWS
jgi:hypothetical protein